MKPLLSDLDPTQMLKVEQVDQAENGKSRGANKPKRRRKCPHCNKISKNLAKHKCKIEKEDGEDDEPEQEYPCTHEGCEENFKSKATRTTHMNKVHGRPKTHKCDACEGMFESGRAVAKHYAEAHPGLKMKFPCSMCDKSYSSKMILKGHMKYVHQGTTILEYIFFKFNIFSPYNFKCFSIQVFDLIATNVAKNITKELDWKNMSKLFIKVVKRYHVKFVARNLLILPA